jgi:hypothetical protein
MGFDIKALTGALGLATALATAAPGLAVAAEPSAQAHRGVIPEGMWVLNQTRSQTLAPGKQTLWIVKDNGEHVVWVSVNTDPQGMVRVISWDGAYGGPPSPVVGTPMVTQLAAPAPGKLHNFGQITGMGPYSEDCDVGPKLFVCKGQVMTPEGVRRWTDDFDWVGPSPQ